MVWRPGTCPNTPAIALGMTNSSSIDTYPATATPDFLKPVCTVGTGRRNILDCLGTFLTTIYAIFNMLRIMYPYQCTVEKLTALTNFLTCSSKFADKYSVLFKHLSFCLMRNEREKKNYILVIKSRFKHICGQS